MCGPVHIFFILYLTMKNVMEIFKNCEGSLAVRKDNSMIQEREREKKVNICLFKKMERDKNKKTERVSVWWQLCGAVPCRESRLKKDESLPKLYE